jgi:hypothetical protein
LRCSSLFFRFFFFGAKLTLSGPWGERAALDLALSGFTVLVRLVFLNIYVSILAIISFDTFFGTFG